MVGRTLFTASLSTLLLLSLLVPARSEPAPAPTRVLEDYEALGVIQVDIPTTPGEKDDPGLALWIPFHQAYLRPGTLWQSMQVLGQTQYSVVTGETERTWSPPSEYIVVRRFQNLDTTSPSPSSTLRMAAVSLGRVARDLPNGKLLPDPDLDELEKRLKARHAALTDERAKLKASTQPTEDILRKNALASEHARITDELKQIPLLRKNPCFLVQYENKDLTNHLALRRLAGPGAAVLLDRGKTTYWITRAEGLPLKIETTSNDGRVALFYCLSDVRMNGGLKTQQFRLDVPEGTWTIVVAADVRQPGWEERMDADIQARQKQFVAMKESNQRQDYNARLRARTVSPPTLQPQPKRKRR